MSTLAYLPALVAALTIMAAVIGVAICSHFVSLLAGCNAAAIAERVDGPLRVVGIDEAGE